MLAHTASRSTHSLNEWFSTRVFVVYFCIDRVAPLYHIYCVRWKLTISSILSLNWLKEEVAYWLNYTYVLHTRFTVSAADMNECSIMSTDVAAIHTCKINRSINSARYRNGNFSFLVLTLSLSRVFFVTRILAARPASRSRRTKPKPIYWTECWALSACNGRRQFVAKEIHSKL